MTIFGHVVRWLRGRPVWAGNCYNPRDTWCRHFCPSSCLTLSIGAALWCHRFELKMNLHPRRSHYDTVEQTEMKPRVHVQSWVGYRMCFERRGVVLCKSRDVEIVQDASRVFNMGGKDHGGVSGKKGYIYSSSCDFIHILRFVRLWTQHGPIFVLHNHQASQEWGASGWYLVLAVRTVCNTGHCFGISYHFYRSDLIHLGANWIVIKLSQLCNHPIWLQTPRGGKSRRNWWHRIENTSLFALRCF